MNKPRHAFATLLLVCSFLFIHISFCIFTFQRLLIFFSKGALPPTFEKVDGVKVYKFGDGPVNIILVHGSYVSTEVHSLISNKLAEKGYTVHTWYYCGLVGNPGITTERAVIREAQILADYLRSVKPVAVIGQSLGTCVASYMANYLNIDILILENPIWSLISIVENHGLYKYVSWLLVDKWKTHEYARGFSGRVLYLLSENDQVVDNANAFMLMEITKNNSYKVIKNASHYTASKMNEWFEYIDTFVRGDVVE